jgi:hypothetical protein
VRTVRSHQLLAYDATGAPSRTLNDSSPEREFLLPWLCSAAVVTVIRLLHAGDLGYDLTIQIQAGQNLLAGKGLTVYWPTADNLADPFTLAVLTHFPAGYSLYAAALMGLGVDVGTLVKVSGAAATLVGWWGWARLAFTYMSEGMRRGRFWRITGYSIAIVSPLLFTSRWAGTDIVLWAAIPWVLRQITRAPDRRAQANLKLDVLAGFLIGLCVLARYASVFLAAYAILVIVGQCRLRVALTAQRVASLGAGMLPALTTQWYINYFLAAESAAPGGVVLNRERLATAGVRAWESVTTLGAANNGLFFWLPGSFRLWTDTAYEPMSLALAGIALIVPALILVARRNQPVPAPCHDVRIVGAGLLIALPLFLWTCGLFGEYAYIGDPRYYAPLRPLAVCIAFFLATTDGSGGRVGVAVLSRYIGRAYMFAFLLITAGEVGYMFVPTDRGEVRRRVLLGTSELRPWPSFRLTYEFSSARNFVLSVMKAEPKALLITNVEDWFYAAPDADRSRIMRWEPCERLRATHIDGPVRLLILVRDGGGASDEVQWSDRPAQRSECLAQLPGLKLIRSFPDEQLKVLQADIREGVRLQIKPAVRETENSLNRRAGS